LPNLGPFNMKSLTQFPLLLAASLTLHAASVPLDGREQQMVAAAVAAPAPHINGPFILGVHPGTPVIGAVAVTGQGPFTFAADALPAGLALDAATGVFTGTLASAGEYHVTVTVKNSQGQDRATLKFRAGDRLALTPPLGWNSYDAFGDAVTEAETRANADWLKKYLQPVGWDTVVIDFRWYDPQPTGNDRLLNTTRLGAALAADQFGRLQPAPNRFPSSSRGHGFKALADDLHAQGLKFGIHVMRGIPRQAVVAHTPILDSAFTAADAGNAADKCGWCPDMFGVQDNAAGQAWYDSCARLWSEWGVDYIKVDDLSQPYHAAEIAMITRAIQKYGHSIVFSTSPGETPITEATDIAAHANLWRISGDFWDHWSKLDKQFTLFNRWQGVGGPGHWPDGDMIPFGHLAIRSGMGGRSHQTHFTRAEQVTLMTLWSLAPSPMILGMNMPDNDAWTTALLTNPEVIAVDQDPAGHPAQRRDPVTATGEVWTKPLADGSLAVGLFNRQATPVTMDLAWNQLGFAHAPRVRDLWLHQDVPAAATYTITLPGHDAALLKATP